MMARPERLRSKFDYHHLSTMRMCLDLGIEALTQEELADCFDEVCTCGGPMTQRISESFGPALLK